MAANGLFKTVVAASICALALSSPKVALAHFGINNNMTYFQSMYADNGTGRSFSQNNNGNFAVSWDSSFTGEFTTGTGWSTWYNTITSPFPWIQVGYNCGAFNASSNGSASLSCYGWFLAPNSGAVDTEFYIVEMSNGHPLGLQGGPIGSVNADGGTYLIYHNFWGWNDPNHRGLSGAPLEQWISIRQGNNTVGQNHGVSTWLHFNAWQSLGWNMGNFCNMEMSAEAYNGSSGYVNCSTWHN